MRSAAVERAGNIFSRDSAAISKLRRQVAPRRSSSSVSRVSAVCKNGADQAPLSKDDGARRLHSLQRSCRLSRGYPDFDRESLTISSHRGSSEYAQPVSERFANRRKHRQELGRWGGKERREYLEDASATCTVHKRGALTPDVFQRGARPRKVRDAEEWNALASALIENRRVRLR